MKNRLKALRLDRHWTQEELANALCVSRQTIIAIEKGKYAPSLPLVFRMSRVLERPIDAIFFQDDEDPQGPAS